MIDLDELEKTNDSELIMLYREDDEDAKNMLFYKYKFIIDILIKKYQHWLSALKIDFQELYSECRDKYKILQDSYSLDFIYDDNSASLIETISDECNQDPLKNMAEKEEYDELILKIKKSLTNKEYEVFVLKSRGFDYQEIARILGKNPKQIDNSIQRIKTKIKKLLNTK